MNKLDSRLLNRIEQVLNIRFHDWQVDYMLGIPRVLNMRITGRVTGKTLVYIIKLLFSDDKPLNAYEIKKVENYSDWYSVTNRPNEKKPHYTQWFRRYLKDIYDKLKEKGIQPRPVFFSKEEEKQFYRT